MQFQSLLFVPFLFFAFIFYHFVGTKTALKQNMVLFVGSVLFLGYNSLESLITVLVVGILNYLLVLQMQALKEGLMKKYFFYFGCLLNLSHLIYYKYLFDILDGVSQIWYSTSQDIFSQVLLPMGLSYYTFQMIGYWIDTYNEAIEPERSPLRFATYIFYFPKFISGPIEPIQNFSQQVEHHRPFDEAKAVDGLRQFLWGFFKKSVIATFTLGIFTSLLGTNSYTPGGGDLLIGGCFQLLYIYFDFSGYSDMACGLSRLFHIEITNNFAFPFFASNISEFWKRWHISLTRWVIQYIFTPISFIYRKRGKWGVYLGILLSFLTVGIWHDLSWNYFLFGTLQSLMFLPLILRSESSSLFGSSSVGFKPFASLGIFLFLSVASLLFRNIPVTENLRQIGSIASPSILQLNRDIFLAPLSFFYWTLFFVTIGFEFFQRQQSHGLEISRFSTRWRWFCYYLLLVAIFFFSEYSSDQFFYERF
jgi:alginate O-acetyltransferase complex protein AlgI